MVLYGPVWYDYAKINAFPTQPFCAEFTLDMNFGSCRRTCSSLLVLKHNQSWVRERGKGTERAQIGKKGMQASETVKEGVFVNKN